MYRHRFIYLFVALVLLSFLHSCKKDSEPVSPETDPASLPTIINLSASYSVADTSVTFKWCNPDTIGFTGSELTITCYNDSKQETLGISDTVYFIKDVVWGQSYNISVRALYQGGLKSNSVSTTVHALDKSEYPAIPLVNVITNDYEMPSCEYVSAPPGCVGGSILNNEYVNCTVEIWDKGVMQYSSGMFVEDVSGAKIRIRGNTSAYTEKKPYKIHLEKSANLFPEISKCKAAHDFVLLKDDNSRNFVGNTVASVVGVKWQPECKYVNLSINGQWQGLYFLSESVERRQGRVEVEDNGFLIENDAYWWNTKVSFHGNHLAYRTGYTFKYPKEEDVTMYQISCIRDTIIKFEDYLYALDTTCLRYIDMESFAKWILCQDLLGNGDPCGSNMFVCCNSFFQENDANARKLFMGPLWDFGCLYYTKNGWSYVRLNGETFYFDSLLKIKAFCRAYVSEFDKIEEDFYADFMYYFTDLAKRDGEAIDESRRRDSELWSEKYYSIEDNVLEAGTWFAERLQWMSLAIDNDMRE